MARPSDNFNGIRLLAACMVMLGHVLLIFDPWGPLLSQPGLLMLFSISGYLVASSWRADPDFWRFLARRFLRIWPAYAVMVLICGGLAATTQPDVAAVFLRSLWFEYHPVGINGSIWMMSVEMSLYLALALAGAGTWLSLLALAALTWWIAAYFGVPWFDFGVFFVTGVLLQAHPQHLRRGPWLFALGSLAWSIGLDELAYLLIIPAATIWIGQRSWAILRSAARFGDLSYGLFLWHAPVLHFVAAPLQLGLWSTAAVTTGITVGLALTSWHLLEKKALRFKPWHGSLRDPGPLRGMLDALSSRTGLRLRRRQP
ncbi:MAG: acyltransferase [Anaerolineae bacterium]|nr:acyltransferase [Anaerolineae bacterium]